jgi:hypothetical protein
MKLILQPLTYIQINETYQFHGSFIDDSFKHMTSSKLLINNCLNETMQVSQPSTPI